MTTLTHHQAYLWLLQVPSKQQLLETQIITLPLTLLNIKHTPN